ncbi:hypothetical protein BBO99_00000448 [Phytophthora kernoviae]|uniref:phosphopyruvate hydratase n=2 Tax=Phytophthora kernoviae TaxID=325452 RepID=A0A3R7K422_9STRA|nr:hypothetical protein G195_003383 [Phytophthora kernoviae 00238/432]KAG2525866.1 hypothetical protein JM16_004203 [Phytophthora kernoviae]KAG2527622.1 hypothetical protein JM18_003693 [Phytophthora kernoviae]RLN20616.1 hypothetical protein BBI17_004523 [Phytophthora kernoviae]RLN85568.1 hypothetical protein BBO99_00000448 [Phytophthora kernoviae]
MPQQQNLRDDQDDDEEEEQVRERDLVEAYVAEHSLESSLNDVINQVVANRPEDPFLMLSSLLYARATAKRGIFYVQVCEVLDALGEPTVLVRLHTGKGIFEGFCSAEAGGIKDCECSTRGLGDESNDAGVGFSHVPPSKQRYGGRGYTKIAAIAQRLLVEKLVGLEPTEQGALDDILQSLESTVGRNVSLAASLAICQAGAKYAEMPLREHVARLQELPPENLCVPMPLFSIVNGGKYASNKLFAQEILLTPTSATSFADALQIGVEFNTVLHTQLEARGIGFTNRGAFGGFAPQFQTLDEVFRVLRAALDDVRARLEDPEGNAISTVSASPLRVEFGVDFAASEFAVHPVRTDTDAASQNEGEEEDMRRSSTYNMDQWVSGSGGSIKTGDEFFNIVRSSVKELEVTTVVDPFDTDDIKSFSALCSAENDNDSDAPPTGDPADTGGSAENGPLAKGGASLGGDPNCQFPTVSRLLQAITNAQHLGFAVILGASAGQPGSDAAILTALAMGAGVGQVKFGGLVGAECLDRYRSLLLASEEPGAPPFVGASAYRR